MSVVAHKHHGRWQSWFAVTIILGALTIFAFLLLKDCSRVLTNWQTGRW